jgi:N-acetylneuraminic acid mutarotase
MAAAVGAPHERRWFNVQGSGELYSARTGHTVVEHGGRFYLFGGTDKQRRQQDLYVFDVPRARWSRLQARGEIPSRRSGALGTEYGGKMYVFGGYEGREQQYFNTIHCFDFEACEWTLVRPAGGEPARALVASNTSQPATRPHPRTDHCLIGHAGQLVVFGGYDGSTRFNDSWSFDLSSRRWRELATRQRPEDKPSRRFGHSGVVFGGRLWAFGGWDGRDTLDCVWSLDLATEVWSSLDTLRAQRSLAVALPASVVAATAASCERECEPPRRAGNANKRTRTAYELRGGGENSSAFANVIAAPAPLEQEHEGQACGAATSAAATAAAAAELAAKPCNRYRHSCVVQGGAMVVFGGVDKDHKRFNDLHRFNFDSLTWQLVSVAGQTPTARTFHRAVALGGKMYIMGGYDGQERLNDMCYVHLGALSPASLSELCAEVVRSRAADMARTGQLQRIPPLLLDSVVWARDREGMLRGGRYEEGLCLCPRLTLAPASARSPAGSLSSSDGAQVDEEKQGDDPQQQGDDDCDRMETDAPQGNEAAAAAGVAARRPENCCTLCGAPARDHDLIEDWEMQEDDIECCEPDLELAAQAELARAIADRKREHDAPPFAASSGSPHSVAWFKSSRNILDAVGLRRS